MSAAATDQVGLGPNLGALCCFQYERSGCSAYGLDKPHINRLQGTNTTAERGVSQMSLFKALSVEVSCFHVPCFY